MLIVTFADGIEVVTEGKKRVKETGKNIV